jgi:very-short-patch-repair endonuclease
VSRPEPLRKRDYTDAEKQRVVEAHYKACWSCIQAGAHHKCRHYRERMADEHLLGSKVNPGAHLRTRQANVAAFGDRAPRDLSPIETRLLEALLRHHLHPVQQLQVGPYVVDFAFPKAHIIVEADGWAYHQDEERERRRDEVLGQHGWHVLHYSGRRIWQGAEACAIEIAAAVRSQLL